MGCAQISLPDYTGNQCGPRIKMSQLPFVCIIYIIIQMFILKRLYVYIFGYGFNLTT